jgi:RNA polymerase sigma-70 factor, ECF subfamily
VSGDPSADAELVTRLRGGDESAFTVLVRRYHPQLVRLARTYVSRIDLAEDVAQETWLALINGLDGFEERSTLQTWIFRICANRAKTAGQRERRTVPVDTSTEDMSDRFTAQGSWATPPQPWAHDLGERLDDEQLLEAVRRAILSLPDLQRQVMTLHDVEGLTPKEVCEVLEIGESHRRVLLHRARLGVRVRIAAPAIGR